MDYFSFRLTPGEQTAFEVLLEDTNRAFGFFDTDGVELDYEDGCGLGVTCNGWVVAPDDGVVVARFFNGSGPNYQMTLSTASVPEPSSSAILLLGVAGLLSTRKRWT